MTPPLLRSAENDAGPSSLMSSVRRIFAWLVLFVLAACGGGGGGSDAPGATPVAAAPAPAQHIIAYGQSLSLGERSQNGWPGDLALPADYVDVGLMFSDGILSLGVGPLGPFRESNLRVDGGVWGISTPGETPLYGALLALKGLPGQRIGSAAGKGATAIAGLGKGSVPYARLLTQVTAAKALWGAGYSVPAIIWMQGESDAGNLSYAAQLTQLIADLQADVAKISGQARPVQFFICTPWPRDIAAADLQLAASVAGVHVACDAAKLEKSDGLHLTARGSRAAGTSLGEAIKAALF